VRIDPDLRGMSSSNWSLWSKICLFYYLYLVYCIVEA
jgi:hypothetical protein